MLERSGGVIIFCCDGCSEFIDTEEEEFSMAHEVRKAMGWMCYKNTDDEWVHYCPICQDKMR